MFMKILSATQPAKYMGPIIPMWVFIWKNKCGAHMGFATGLEMGPTWASPYGLHVGTIWAKNAFIIIIVILLVDYFFF